MGIHYNVGKTVLDYVTNKDDFAFTDGWVELPKLPGLGVEVNKELVIEENKTPHNWKNPVWRHADGSVRSGNLIWPQRAQRTAFVIFVFFVAERNGG